MDFKADFSHPLAAEWKRIVTEQFDYANGCLEQVNGPRAAESIHEFRKALKKLRAILRMTASGLPRDGRRQWRAALRDMASALAQNRDDTVLSETLSQAYQSIAHNSNVTAKPWSILPMTTQGTVPTSSETSLPQLDLLRATLRDTAAAIVDFPNLDLRARVLFEGFDQSYREGRSLLRRLDDASPPERLHAFRKRVKEQFYQTQFLANLSPKSMKRRAARFDRLGELLGAYHDLVNLRTAIKAHRIELCLPLQRRTLLDWTQQQILDRKHRALKLARRLYRNSPRTRLRRLRHRYLARTCKPES